MKSSEKEVVEKMFAAFAKGDVEGFTETVSDNTVWIYHGTQVIPKGTFRGKDGVQKFVNNILDNTEVISFEPLEYIIENHKVVVLGREHQKVKSTSKELKQKWVQVYTVENELITKMEEFATSEIVN